MKQYQVPQFLTIEDKVIGPFTIRQAVYLGAGAALIVGARMFLKSYLFFPIAVFVGGLAVTLAFLKINGQPFPIVLKNAFLYVLRPRLYIWRRVPTTEKKEKIKRAEPETPATSTQKLTKSKLSDLAWSLDIHEKLQK